jgi:hypothetical protein
VIIFCLFYKVKNRSVIGSRHQIKRRFRGILKCSELWLPLPLEVCMKTYSWLDQNRFLSHMRTIFCALAITGALLALSSSGADRPGRATSTREPASGGFFPCFNFAGPPRQAGENLIVTFNISGSSTGTFTSTSTGVVGTELDVVHRDGSITLHGSLLFTGSVNGGPEGTMLFTYEGIGNAVTGHETLRFVGTRGTGGLAGVYANLTAEGDVGAPSPGCDVSGEGTYSGYVVFDR